MRKVLFKGFEKEAKKKIESLKDLKVIGVTEVMERPVLKIYSQPPI